MNSEDGDGVGSALFPSRFRESDLLAGAIEWVIPPLDSAAIVPIDPTFLPRLRSRLCDCDLPERFGTLSMAGRESAGQALAAGPLFVKIRRSEEPRGSREDDLRGR